MKARLEAQKVAPAAYQAMLGLEMFVRKQSKLEPALIELVKMRVSQINGCAYCIDMQVRGGKEVTLGPGGAFYEGPEDVHTVGRNASTTEPAKFLVFFVKDKGAPVLVPAK